jgi:hypothetical protein
MLLRNGSLGHEFHELKMIIAVICEIRVVFNS